MAEKLLNVPEIRTGSEQVGGVAVAQGVRGHHIGQAERGAELPELALKNAGMEGLAGFSIKKKTAPPLRGGGRA